MPNICNFDMKIVGKQENVEKFIKVLQAHYNYETNEFSFERHLFRIFESEIYDAEEKDDGEISVQINGDCAWSVQSCMFENGYYDSVKKNYNKNFHGTTVPIESKNLNLKIEIYSTEPGCQFQEHYLIDNGNVVIDDCVEYIEYWIDGYNFKTKEEAEKEFDVKFTDEEWENNDGVICRGGFDNWDFEI